MNEPKLRFKADDGSNFPDWEEKTLGDIGTAKMCKRVLKEQTSEKGDVPFYKIGTFGGTPDAFISRELYEELKTKYSFPRKGNILLSAAGTIGRTVVYDGQDAFFQDSNIVWLDNNDSVLDGFLLQFYNKTSWDNLEGGTIKRLYNGLFLSKVIHVPSLPEQQKIAEFLSTIDTVIAKQKETVSAWEERKKGVMQKLFSQEVRFKADDGSEFPEWEEKKIGEILAVHHGKDYKNLKKGNVPVYGTGGIITYVEDFLCDWACVCIGRKGTIDKPLYIDAPFWCVDTLFFTKAKDKHIPKFQFYLFQMIPWKKYNEASGVPSLNASTIQNINVTIPCFEEQQKIADCLSSLDEVIEKQKATLAAWEALKKGLLQQMFA